MPITPLENVLNLKRGPWDIRLGQYLDRYMFIARNEKDDQSINWAVEEDEARILRDALTPSLLLDGSNLRSVLAAAEERTQMSREVLKRCPVEMS